MLKDESSWWCLDRNREWYRCIYEWNWRWTKKWPKRAQYCKQSAQT